MEKLRVKIRPDGEKFDIISEEGFAFYGVECLSIKDFDAEGYAQVCVRLEVSNKEEWDHLVVNKKGVSDE